MSRAWPLLCLPLVLPGILVLALVFYGDHGLLTLTLTLRKMKSTRRDFIKSALLIVAAGTAAPAVLASAWKDIKADPEIAKILEILEPLEPNERKAIAQFIISFDESRVLSTV